MVNKINIIHVILIRFCLLIGGLASLCSCVQDELLYDNSSEVQTEKENGELKENSNWESTALRAQISSFRHEVFSRATISDDLSSFTWCDGDKIGLFYQGEDISAGAAFSIEKGGESVGTFLNTAFKLNGNSTYYAFYPYDYELTPQSAILDFAGQEQIANNSAAHIGRYNYMVAEAQTNNVGGADFKFQNIGSVINVKIQVPSSGRYKKMTLSLKNGSFIVKGAYKMQDGSMTSLEREKSVELSFGSELDLKEGDSLSAFLVVAPIDLSNDEIIAQLETETERYAFEPILGKKMEAGFAYTYEFSHQISLNLLCIGNSYSLDALSYLPHLLKSAGVKFHVGMMYIPACTLETHYNNWKSSSSTYVYYKNAGNGWEQKDSQSIPNVVSADNWDVVCFHQASHYSGKLATITPYLPNLLNMTEQVLPKAKIAYLMTPAWGIHNTGFGTYYANQDEMYESICSVAQDIQSSYNIDYLIPVCTSVQNARHTELDTYGDDLFASATNRHLDRGIGRLIASYTVFDTLIGQLYNISYNINDFLPDYGTNVDELSHPQTCSFAPVTTQMAIIGQECVALAGKEKFKVSLKNE